MRDQRRMVRGIGLKVLAGFSVVLLAIVFAGIINFLSLNRLIDSVHLLSQPDLKIIRSHQLLDQLDNEENNVRAYSLTQDSQYVRAYKGSTDSVHRAFIALENVASDNRHEAEVTESIRQLVGTYEGLMNRFIERKSAQIDSQKLASRLPVAKPVLSETAAKSSTKDSAIQKKGFFKRVFGPKSKPVQLKAAGEAEQSTAMRDSTPYNLANLNVLFQKQDAEINKQIRERGIGELIMLQQVKDVMNNIRSKVSLLEKNENIVNAARANAAGKVVAKSRQVMIIVGFLGILTTLLFIYLILADVGRGRRLHAQLVEERGRAEKLARVKEEFLANMSHEIRTPLNSIVGFAEQLSLGHQDKNQSQFTQAIQRSANHLLALVNQVLDFSKIEAGKQQNADEPFDLFELLRDVYDTFKMRAEEKKISLTWHTHGYVPQYLQGNALSLKQIMINLTANAIKFTERGGVTINCNSEPNKNDSGILLRIEVQDTGIGIPAEMTEKIFEEFNQSQPSVSRKFGGTGLGLTITKRLTEFLNGSVEVKSEPGSGSLFTVMLPFKKAETALVNSAEVAIDAVQPVFSGRKILIADDEEMNVFLCKTILNKWGIETQSAGDGQEALSKFFSEDFDAVLLDLQMPGIDGIAAANSIRASADPKKKNVPLIALTANVYSNQERELANADFNTVLFKPFREKELAAVLTKLFHTKENNSGDFEAGHFPAEKLNDEQPLYNLEYLRKTSGSNHEFLISMLESFIENNDRHLKLLADAASMKDWKTAGQVAHKMIPSYRYLQITETEIKLKRIEESAAENNEVHNIPGQVAEISESTQMVFGLLRTEIQGLKDEVVVPITDQEAYTSIKL